MQIAPIEGANARVFEDVETNLTVLGPGSGFLAANHGMFRILNQEDGDKRVVWDKGSITEINDAKKLFDTLVEMGVVPYKVDARGKRTTEVMAEFDPHAEEIIFVPMKQVVGG